jgi:hypothetical protein
MFPTYLVWVGIFGLIVALLLPQIVSLGKKALTALSPSAATSPTVQNIEKVAENAGKYASYATAHGALYTLRLVDFGSPNLDISAELTAIDAKLAAAVKAGNTLSTSKTV